MLEPQSITPIKDIGKRAARLWVMQPPAPPEFVEQAKALHLSRLTAQLLYTRQINTPEAIDYFFHATFSKLADAMLMKNMDLAVARVKAACAAGERIAIYGDFDADGVTGCTLLVQYLRAVGADVIPRIPHRVNDGYGLNKAALAVLAEDKVKLVITVDCGVSNVEEIAYAKTELNMDVIVTDHHRPPDPLPSAAAIINVRQPGDNYPYKNAAGVGMAFHLVRALSKNGLKPKNMTPRDLLDLVALGTIADIAPLTGENRVLVTSGLKAINQAKRPGLQALIEVAGLKPGQVDAFAVGFYLAPRINAAGRIDDATLAYELLLTEDLGRARQLAEELNLKNRERQNRLGLVLEEAHQCVEREKLHERGKIIVLAGESWPAGVVGLVAGRLCEEYSRPVLVMEKGEKWCKGSARSTEAFNVVEALVRCDDLLERYGGHSAAAGFTLAIENLAEFEQRLLQIAESSLEQGDLVPKLEIDAEISAGEIPDAFEQSFLLSPFGSENPPPLFLTRDLVLREARAVGNEGAHLKLKLFDAQQGRIIDGIAFREGARVLSLKPGQHLDIVYTIEQGEWQGQKRFEIKIKDFRETN